MSKSFCFPSLKPPHRKINEESHHENIVNDILNRIHKAKNSKGKLKIYLKFSQKYFIPRLIWWEFERDTQDFQFYKDAMYHFYYNTKIENIYGYHLKLLEKIAYFPFGTYHDLMKKDHPIMKKIVNELTFPQKYLKNVLMWYEEYSSSPISTKLIKNAEKMHKLYWKIKEAEDNLEEWLNCLKEANDPIFVRHNIEQEIGRNLNNKKLYKLYISYLREIDPKEMLQVYSKYCRLFLDDFEMKKEYKNATEKYGPALVSWKNPFEFEHYTPKVVEIREPKNPDFSLPLKKPLSINFSEVLKFSNQRSSPLFRYLIDNAKPKLYLKLQQTCKYFFFQNPKLYCHRFLYTFYVKYDTTVPKFLEHSLRLSPDCSNPSLKAFENRKLILISSLKISYNSPNSILSDLIKDYIYECHVKYIYICCQIITKDEFHFLTRHGNVESFQIVKTSIVVVEPENNKSISLKEILKMLPKIQVFEILQPEANFIPIFDDLSEIKLNQNLLHFYFENVSNQIFAKDLCNFLENNTTYFTEFKLTFDRYFNYNFITHFEKDVSRMLKERKPLKETPIISFHRNHL